jgi:hypothetical protein
MPASWYFYTTKRGEIILRGRFEGADGTLGDAIECIRPGETFMGLPYLTLKASALRHGRRRARQGDDFAPIHTEIASLSWPRMGRRLSTAGVLMCEFPPPWIGA